MNSFWKNRRVMVTGAAGFIGSHAVDLLIQSGAHVTATISPRTGNISTGSNLVKAMGKITLKRVDLLDPRAWLQLTQSQEIVFHFAGLDGGTTYKNKHNAEIMRVNTQLTMNLLEAAVFNKVKRLLIMSSTDVYGLKPDFSLKESDFTIDDYQQPSGYRWSKIFSEMLAKVYAREHGTKIAIARCGSVYGPRDDIRKQRVISTFISSCLRGKTVHIWGNAEQKRSYLYVTDLITGLFSLVERYPCAEPVNIAGMKYVSYKELVNLIIELTKSKSDVVEMKPPSKFACQTISVQKARKVIRFHEAVTLRQGLKNTIEYFKKT